jgi:hypothetical protein
MLATVGLADDAVSALNKEHQTIYAHVSMVVSS